MISNNIDNQVISEKDKELEKLDDEMKQKLKEIKIEYAQLKRVVKSKYKTIKSKNRKSIPKCLKILVWDETFGKECGVGKCDVCLVDIDSKNFECGHIQSVANDGPTVLDNLKPICSSCNKSMGIQNLNDFKCQYFPNRYEKVNHRQIHRLTISNTTNNRGNRGNRGRINNPYGVKNCGCRLDRLCLCTIR
jgi:hypothetical protein